MIFRGIFRKFPENINKTLIAARPLSARDSCNVLCLFGFGVVDKKMFYTTVKLKNLKANHNLSCEHRSDCAEIIEIIEIIANIPLYNFEHNRNIAIFAVPNNTQYEV